MTAKRVSMQNPPSEHRDTERTSVSPIELIDKLEREQCLPEDEWVELIEERSPEASDYLLARARAIRDAHYGRRVFVRGLIEFTNYCRNDCRYCGIRAGNRGAHRYRLGTEEILDCCEKGYALGFRTFVLQGGEDPFFTDEALSTLVKSVRTRFPDCAITLSVGERSRESYHTLHEAGADRYLLRHETADAEHYATLHPAALSCANRQQCLRDLRDLGYQVGSGFMAGSPGQTPRHLARDMAFLHELQPHMVGIGPFIPHRHTAYANETAGTLELTLFMLAALRLMLPKTLLPATTALGTIHERGRELGLEAGANVLMPNLSPACHRADYNLYEGKAHAGLEAAEGIANLAARLQAIGYEIVVDRGDSLVR